MRSLKPGFIGRTFFGANWHLWANWQSISVDDQTVRWVDVKEIQETRFFYFWRKLKFQTVSDSFQLGAFPGSQIRWMQDSHSFICESEVLLGKLDDLLRSDRYIARSDTQEIYGSPIALDWIKKLTRKSFFVIDTVFEQKSELLREIASKGFATIDARNRNYVAAELVRFSSFFRNVEVTALTQEQAEAAVVMEDHQLVVAAAGSGKTSTLVAKVGYAVKKGYVDPDEILILSFNRSVKEEIEARISARLKFGADLLSPPAAETFHSLGYRIVRQVDRDVRLAPWAASEALTQSIIWDCIREEAEADSKVAQSVAEFAAMYLGDEKSEIAQFKAMNGAILNAEWTKLQVDSISTDSIVLHKTLSGEIVRSFQEMRICNWLTIHGINFEYEKPFDHWGKLEPWEGGYRPDFYYPDIDCWHEHFGQNKFGKSPESWAKAKGRNYDELAEDKRRLLTKTKTDWFETRSADFSDWTWDEKLKNELESRGLKPKFVGWERFSELMNLAESKDLDSLVGLVQVAIKHFKGSGLALADLGARIRQSREHVRADRFFEVFQNAFRKYEEKLREGQHLDFDDMILRACEIVESDAFEHPYKMILVDEFQDISRARARMISALLKTGQGIRLFAVGDDWQSIYRFTGSDISIFTEFSKTFSYAHTSYLSHTFRSRQGIVDVATEFVTKNPIQLKKDVKASSRARRHSVRVVFHSGKPESAIVRQLEWAYDYAEKKDVYLDVCFLGRYNFQNPEPLADWADRFKGRLNLSFMTIHKSKGLGFDMVIVLGMTDYAGRDFPSSKQDDPILQLFKPEPETFLFAEERRLFYVALTRAKMLAVLMTPKHEGSIFVREVLATRFKDVVLAVEAQSEEDVLSATPVASVDQKICPRCKRRRLLPRISKFGPWIVCEGYATKECDYKKDLKMTGV
jgi:DNA helicase-4